MSHAKTGQNAQRMTLVQDMLKELCKEITRRRSFLTLAVVMVSSSMSLENWVFKQLRD